MEDALFVGKSWHNRAFLQIEMENGRVTGGSVSNNHTNLRGTVDEGTFRFDDGQLAGKAAITVIAGRDAVPESYSFTIDGGIVGRYAAGGFAGVEKRSRRTKGGRFWCALE